MKKSNQNHFKSYIENKLFTPTNQKNSNEIGSIGIELETFPHLLDTNDGKKHPASLFGSKQNVSEAVATFSENHKVERVHSINGAIIDKIIYDDGDLIRFEPGGQIELITTPCGNIDELESKLLSKQEILHQLSKETAFRFTQYGTNPWHSGQEIGLQMNLDRYSSMMRYFNEIGPCGKQMMLQTCSMHLNFDLGGDEETRIKRYVLASLLSPITTALFANSWIVDGKQTKYKSYRNYLWQNLDPLRTGTLPLEGIINSWSKDVLIDEYAQFAMKAPLIYLKEMPSKVLSNNYTMGHWLSNSVYGTSPDVSDYDNHLSLLFPNVRLKGYLELRSIDVPPIEWQMIPVMFYSGLLYSDKHMNKALDLLLPLSSDLSSLSVEALYGLDSDRVFSISKQVLEIAIDGFSELPASFKKDNNHRHFERFAEEFTYQRKVFADKNYSLFL